MIRDITIGQYYRANSPIHALDPRVKIAGTFFFIISLFFKKSLIVYAIATLFLALVIRCSKVPFRFICRGLKAIIFILLFSVVVNMFFTPGEELFHIGIFRLTKEGVIMAVYLSIRLIYLILGSSILTFTTTPNQLTSGLEKMFGFLNKIRVPVSEIAMMMSIALRFIPILTEELDKIMKAQMARGADFNEGNLIQKMKNMIPLLVPLFVSAIRRANDLAMAMEARCYHGGEGRTKMKPLRYSVIDKKAYAILILYMAIMIIASIMVTKLGIGI